MAAVVKSVHASATHRLSKQAAPRIRLLAGMGVQGDVHAGTTVKHRSRVRRDPSAPNLRQVHLIHGELHDELRDVGFHVGPGVMGENITTRNLDLLELPVGTLLRIGGDAVIEATGLRNPCIQLDVIQQGLMGAVLGRSEDGGLVRKAGIMAVVLSDGDVSPGDAIDVELPPPPHRQLHPV